MTAPEGTLNLIVDMDIEDTATVEYQLRPGSDLVTIQKKGLRVSREAVAHFELQNSSGLIIAVSEAIEMRPGTGIGLSFLKAVKPLVIK